MTLRTGKMLCQCGEGSSFVCSRISEHRDPEELEWVRTVPTGKVSSKDSLNTGRVRPRNLCHSEAERPRSDEERSRLLG